MLPHSLITKVITQTFEEKAGKFQSKLPENQRKALLVSFRIKIDHEKESGYRELDMLIYGPLNYIGVYVRERWTVIPLEDLEEGDDPYIKAGKEYNEGASEWKQIAYHDSGWRTDGVDRTLWENRERIEGFDGLSFYKVVNPPAGILASG